MLGALITFLVLFGLIRIFEKDRDDLDNFTIATVAVVPVLAVIIVNVALAFLFPDPMLLMVVPTLVLTVLTFGLLWKHLEFPLGSSAVYTVVVVLVNGLIGFLMGGV